MKKYEKYKESGIQWIGHVPEHWGVGKIKMLCDSIFAGATPSTSNDSYWNGNIPWIPSGCCHDCDINSAPKFITEEGYNGSSTKMIPANTTVMAMTGATCAQLGYLKIDACANQSVVAFVENKSRANSRFLFYSLWAARKEILTHQTGGAQAGINQEDCANIYIPMISLSEQQAIAEYLDKKTAKIDESVAALEAQKADLQKYRAAVISEAVTHGLDATAKMKNSGVEWIGQIPDGWEVVKVKHLGDARNGLTYSPGDVKESGVLVLRSSNIQDSKLCYEDNVYVASASENLYMKEGDLLICSRNGSLSLVGKTAYVETDMNAVFGAFMMRFRPNHRSKYVFYMIQNAIRNYKAMYATSTVNQLTTEVFGNMCVPIPPFSEQQAIAEYLDKKTAKIDESIALIDTQITDLQAYRSAVITEAVTGKVKVSCGE